MRLFPVQSNESPSSPRSWRIGLIAGIAILSALAGSGWLAHHAVEARAQQAQAAQNRELSSKARLLAQEIVDDLEVLKTRALGVLALRKIGTDDASLAAVDSLGNGNQGGTSILYWAQAERKGEDRSFRIRASLRNPFWKDGALIDDIYLEQALERVNEEALRAEGIALLRLKQDPQRNNEWLAVAFPADKRAPTHKPLSIVVALVNPVDAFQAFRNWSGRGESGLLRAYLVASDGLVLAHSQRAYAWADFSRTEVYRDGLRAVFEGGDSGGVSRYQAIDQLKVAGAFVPAGNLPLSVVLEQVFDPGVGKGFFEALENRLVSLSTWLALGAALLLGSAILAIRIGLRAWRSSRVPVIDAPAELHETMNEFIREGQKLRASHRALQAQERELERLAPRDGETFILQEIPPTGEARMESPRSTRNPLNEAVDSQVVEDALTQDLRTAPEASRALLEQRIAATRFELEIAKLRDARQVFDQLASYAHRISEAPALVFSFDISKERAVLQSGAGFPEGTELEELFFPVPPNLQEQVVKNTKQGRILSLGEYPALRGVISNAFRTPRFRAWAVAQAGSGRLLGVLVILKPKEPFVITETLVRAIRSIGQVSSEERAPARRPTSPPTTTL